MPAACSPRMHCPPARPPAHMLPLYARAPACWPVQGGAACVLSPLTPRTAAGEGPCILTFWVTAYWQLLVLRLLTGISLGGGRTACLPATYLPAGTTGVVATPPAYMLQPGRRWPPVPLHCSGSYPCPLTREPTCRCTATSVQPAGGSVRPLQASRRWGLLPALVQLGRGKMMEAAEAGAACEGWCVCFPSGCILGGVMLANASGLPCHRIH